MHSFTYVRNDGVYCVNGTFIYRQRNRKTDNRHAKQVAYKRLHHRFLLGFCIAHFCDNWKFLRDEIFTIHRGLRGFFSKNR